MWLTRVRSGHRLKEWLTLKIVPVVLGAPVPDIMRVLFYRRAFCGVHFATLQQRLLRGTSDWSMGERELFAAFVSAKNCCRFCIDAHSAIAARLVGHEVVDAIMADVESAPISEPARRMLYFLEKLTLEPDRITSEDLAPLRAAKISDEAILDAIYICGTFCALNRLVDAMGCAPMTPKQLDASAKMLLERGY